jgi:hypothetical protein
MPTGAIHQNPNQKNAAVRDAVFFCITFYTSEWYYIGAPILV